MQSVELPPSSFGQLVSPLGDPLGQWVSFQCLELGPNLCVWCWSAPSGCWEWVVVAIADTQMFLSCPCPAIMGTGLHRLQKILCFVVKSWINSLKASFQVDLGSVWNQDIGFL